MKKIGKLTLRNLDMVSSDILQKKELKHILGGYGTGTGRCCYSNHYSNDHISICYFEANCEEYAGTYGWWCCGCRACGGY